MKDEDKTKEQLIAELAELRGALGDAIKGKDQHRQAVEALRKSEDLLKRSQEIAHLGSWELDLESNVLTWSDEVFRIFGLQPGEASMSYETFLASVHPDDRAAVNAAYAGSIREGFDTYEIEHRVVRKSSGEVLFVYEKCKHIRDSTGRIIRSVGMVLDITERRMIEEQLRESRQMLQSVLDTIPVRVFWKDLNLNYLGCNRSFARDAGFSDPEELLGKSDYAMGWHEHADLYRADDRQVIESGVPKLNFEEPVTMPDGKKAVLRTSKITLRDASGRIRGILGTCEDITDRKKMEDFKKFLAQSGGSATDMDFFHSLAEYLGQKLDVDFVCIDRLDGRKLDATTVAIYFDGRFEDNVTYALKDTPCGEMLENGICYISSGVCELFPNDRVLLDMKAESYAGVILWDHLGKPIGLIALIWRKPLKNAEQVKSMLQLAGVRAAGELERTLMEEEKERLEAKLLQAQKLETIGTLAGGIAHDFNNLLQPISSCAELIRSRISADDQLGKYVDLLSRSVERGRGLVKQLLTFSRQRPQERRPLRLQPVVNETLSLLRAVLPSAVEIQAEIDPACGAVVADPVQIQQVVMNLCNNACDAMNRDGLLAVSLSEVDIDQAAAKGTLRLPPGRYARLVVRDTGHGMDDETMKRIFDPFFTTKEVGKGTGLGLSVVHGIIMEYDGDLMVESEPGIGSTFTAYLPCSEEVVEEESEGGKMTFAGGKETILFVDDEEDIAFIAREMLEDMGYNVTAMSSNTEALEELRRNPEKYDLAISDYSMPGMNGLQLAEELLNIRPDIPILLISGNDEAIPAERLKATAVRGVISKPFRMKEIGETIRRVLDEKNVK